MSTTLAYEYLSLLRNYIEAQAISDPPIYQSDEPGATPETIVVALVKVGLFQDSPTLYPVSVTLHEALQEELGVQQTWTHTVDEGEGTIEMGGFGPCTQRWTYRYVVSFIYNMTISGESQAQAHEKGSIFGQWLRKKINTASVYVLGLTPSSLGETATHQRVVKVDIHEQGGPTSSYIIAGKLFIEQQVYVQ